MDGLSGAASVMAAVSLTLQLVTTVNTLREFWLGMKGAPADIQDIIEDLSLLNDILYGIDRAYALHEDPNDHDAAHAKAIYGALLQCQKHVDRMRAFAENLRTGMSDKHHWTAFKTVLHKQKLAEFARHIERAKSTLLMAINVTTLLLQNECGRAVQAEFAALRSDMMEFAMDASKSTSRFPVNVETSIVDSPPPPYQEENRQRGSSEVFCSKSRGITVSDVLLWLLKLPPDSRYRQSLFQYGRLVGRIAWKSSTRLVNNDQHTGKTLKDSMILSLELPIIRRSFTIHSEKYFGQWRHSFRMTRIVPDNSAIFKFCATQDLAAIRQLFDSGVASPFDQTTSGITLLHAAAAGYRCQTYKFLSDAGVEYSLCEDSLYGKLTPLELNQSFTLCIEGRIQTVQDWLGIDEEQKSVHRPEKNYDCVTRIWNRSLEMKDNISDSEIITLLQGPLRPPRDTEALLDIAKEASSANKTMARYSGAHLLLCYYFLFHHDPYGCRVTKATIYAPSLDSGMPLYDYIGQYWDRDEWLQLLSRCADLDFHALARRQQDKPNLNSSDITWEIGPGNKKIAKISSNMDRNVNIWIGPLKDWEGVFEFEENHDSAGLTGGNEAERATGQKEAHLSPGAIDLNPLLKNDLVKVLVKCITELTWLRWTISSFIIHYFLHQYIFR